MQRHHPGVMNPTSAGEGPLEAPPPPIAKKRRGRQPRPSLLTPALQTSIASFADTIGKPSYQPGGFRDFTGWLDSIAAPQHRSAWESLCSAFLRESASVDARDVPQLKKDVVTELMRSVVKRKPNESSKLVSTNARRQCATPSSGNTVMKIFESYLSTSASRHGSAAGAHGSGSNAASRLPRAQLPTSSSRGGSSGGGRHHGQNPHHHSQQRQVHGSEGKAPRMGGTPSVRELLASGQSASGGGSRAGGSGMDISSLLTEDPGPQTYHGRSSSSSARQNRQPMLPSLSQMDEQIRARKEKERRNRR